MLTRQELHEVANGKWQSGKVAKNLPTNSGCPYHCVPLPAAPVELRWPEAHTPHGNDEKLYGKYSYIGATRRNLAFQPNWAYFDSIANAPKAADRNHHSQSTM